MSDKMKNILKIAGIWYLINFCLVLYWGYWTVFEEHGSYKELFTISFSAPIVIFLVTCFCLSPAVAILYYLIKKRNKSYKVIPVSLIIAASLFLIMIGCIWLFDFIFPSDDGFLAFFICSMIGFLLIVSAFSTLITAVCVPQSNLPCKWTVVKTTLMTILFNSIFMFILAGIMFIFLEFKG